MRETRPSKRNAVKVWCVDIIRNYRLNTQSIDWLFECVRLILNRFLTIFRCWMLPVVPQPFQKSPKNFTVYYIQQGSYTFIRNTDADFYEANLISFSCYPLKWPCKQICEYSFRMGFLCSCRYFLSVVFLFYFFYFNALKTMVCVFYWRMTTHTRTHITKRFYIQWTRLNRLYA